MIAADFLAAAEALPLVDLDTLSPDGALVVVAPHPDDETLGCGGLIADACSRGRHVEIVCVSDGGASHPGSRAWPRPRLSDLRAGEARVASAILGLSPDRLTFIGLADGGLPRMGPDFDRAVDIIAGRARACGAATICVTWAHDPHRDHQAAHAMAAAAALFCGAGLLSYPVWGHTLAPATEVSPGLPRGGRLDITRHVARKARAIAAHRSQLGLVVDDDPDGFVLDREMQARFVRPFEIFLQ